MDGRLTITEVAKTVGVTPRTIMRWEKTGKIKKSKRDWRGWRFYTKGDAEEIKRFYETSYEYEEFEKSMANVVKSILVIVVLAGFLSSYIICGPLYAATDNFAASKGLRETETSVEIVLDELPVAESTELPIAEAVKYTLGPDDVIGIEVRRHPEFSGQYTVNSEGKIEYKYVGDIIVSGLTKTELKERLEGVLSNFIIEPEIDVQIVAYLSKVFYVVGEVGNPGKFYMRGDTITVREALVQAGLPAHTAEMKQCRLIKPNDTGKNNYVTIDANKLLFKGDLRQNLVMEPGDVLYIPPTLMAKIIRVISPVTNVVGQTAGTATSAAAAAGL